MKQRALPLAALRGAVAGAAAGLAFAAAMRQSGALVTVASIVHASPAGLDFVAHLLVAAAVGAGFGTLVSSERLGVGELLFWGLTYGMVWWFVGALTVAPMLLAGRAIWTVAAAQAALPSLFGHLWYGAITALIYAAITPGPSDGRPRVTGGTVGAGVLAGVAGAWLLERLIATQSPWLGTTGLSLATSSPAHRFVFLTGVLGGLVFALLYPQPRDAAGPGLIRGALFGFVWWAAAALSALPEINGGGLAWSLEAVRARFPALPAFVLYGGLVALVYRWLLAAGRLLFADDATPRDEEGTGTRGLRAIGRGAFAGLIGGLVFTLVMVRVGFLPTVAQIVGAASPWSGFLVHLVIANIIGASYGLLFLGRSVGTGSALGWGVSYGFFWWILGPLTLLPVLLGGAPRWTPQVAGALIPSLVGHLAYGGAVGIVFYLLEVRYNPWWVPHTELMAAQSERRRAEVLASASALWVLVVMLGLTLPIMLACGMAPAYSGTATARGAYGQSSGEAGPCP